MRDSETKGKAKEKASEHRERIPRRSYCDKNNEKKKSDRPAMDIRRRGQRGPGKKNTKKIETKKKTGKDGGRRKTRKASERTKEMKLSL